MKKIFILRKQKFKKIEFVYNNPFFKDSKQTISGFILDISKMYYKILLKVGNYTCINYFLKTDENINNLIIS